MISPLTLSKKFVTVCILSVSVYSNTSWADANSSTEVYRFGVVPQQSASQLATLWVPFIKKIRELSGVNIKFETATNIPIFEKRVGKKHYDFVYMNPYHYVVAHDLVGYQALVREKNKKIKGILVVKKNGGIRSVHDLEKKRLAFPSIAAFAATIIPSNSLKKKQISIKANYVASHDSVYKTVSMGLYDAGGGIRRTYNALDKVIRDQLEIIWESRGHTPHAFAVKPGI
ncbi:MAG: phosphate/phosphite/phosphonate ABC transporter substrate-binding protein [Gammaproteobacteria bacterium]|nr:phosphate/phosphite/phosphonate ABC transporter substrate-binding protein [Gammaproteobacteria bacterium]